MSKADIFEVCNDHVIEKDGLKVEVTYIGEGYYGDYDETDPDDVPLCRFYVSRWNSEESQWDDLDNASYCTLLPAWHRRGQTEVG